MYQNRFARLHLSVEREQPAAWDVPSLLVAWGLHDQPQESLWVIAYDASMQVRTVIEIARGDYHTLDVPIAAVVSAVLVAGCNRFVIAHNHPTGDVTPTTADIDLTRKILDAANTVGIYFENHYIIGPRGESMDFVSEGLIGRSAELTALAASTRRRRR